MMIDKCVPQNDNFSNQIETNQIKTNQIKTNQNEEMSIAWRNLRFEVKQFAGLKKKVILNSLNGSFKCNSLNGLMGPSGAGKTTLLNCLSGLDTSGLVKKSEIYLNSSNKNPVSFYITQHVHESIVQRMSVGDILRYAFKFKNSNSLDVRMMDEHIESIMRELLLPLDLLNRYFVDCSGGEQKRIAIGQELMSLQKPSFLFIDEPTTGLDSAAALEVVTCLAELTKKHQITVIASIHAPNSEILSLFDQLYVLSKGGVCIYSGAPEMIQSTIEMETLVTPVEGQPPIEVLIRLACNGIENENEDVLKLAQKTLLQEHEAIVSKMDSLSPNGLPNIRKSFQFSDLFTNLNRTFHTTFISNYRSCIQATLLYVVFFLLMSTLFNHSMASASDCLSIATGQSLSNCTTQLENETLFKENAMFLCFTIMYVGLVMAAISCTVFSSNITIFRSEHRNHWYSLSVYYWSSTLVALLELTLYCALITICAYFLSFQHSIDNYQVNFTRFSIFLLFMWLLCAYVQSFVQLIGTVLVGRPDLVIVVFGILYTFANMMGGFFVDLERNGGNAVFVTVSNFVGLKFITKGILYSIYGIDRCDPETEMSFVMKIFYVEPEKIYEYVLWNVVTILILRFIAVCIMFVKFSTIFTINKSTNSIIKKSNDAPFLLDFIKSNDSKVEIENIEAKTDSNPMQVVEQITLHEKVILAWRDLTLFESGSIQEQVGMNLESQEKTILQNLNGEFKFGTLNALMGTSGSGKTSLLKALNGQHKSRLSDCTRFYLSRFATISTCFITQEVSDHLWSGLTAKQFLMYASRLKNQEEDQIDHEKIAMNVLDELDLMDTVHTDLDRCSGGERKRLALAAELTATGMPNLVCIDEPTSGLDSNSAETVISCLHKLVQLHPITILASIHQPNSSILAMFDQLYVLARGGVCIYSGPPNQVESHLNKLSSSDQQTKTKYPIDELIKHSCRDNHNSTVQKLVQLTNEQFIESDEKMLAQTQLTLDGVQQNRQRFSLQSSINLFRRYFSYFRGHLWKESTFYIFNYLFYGFVLKQFYDKKMIYVSGCIDLQDDFNQTCDRFDETNHLINNVKYTYFYISFFFFFLLLQSGLVTLKELALFKNEHHNGWYSSGSFYLTKCIVESIQLIPVIVLYVYICNWHEEVRPGIYPYITLLLILSSIGYQAMGHLSALVCNGNMTILSVGSTSIYLFFTLLSNVFLSYSHLHYVYQFISNFSISRFIFEATILLQYGFGRCGPKEIQSVLYMMSLKDDDYRHCVVMLVLNLVLYRLLALYLLTSIANPKQNRRKRAERIWQSVESKCSNSNAVPGLGVSFYQFEIKQFGV